MFTNIIRSREINQQGLEKFVLAVEKEYSCQSIKIVEPVVNVALQNLINN